VLALGALALGLIWTIAQRQPGHLQVAVTGQPLPAFRLPLLGQPGSSPPQLAGPADHAGTPLLLHFWAPSCPPCVAELPRWQRLQRSATPDLAILTVAGDDGASVQQFLRRGGYTLPVVLDATGSVHRALQIEALPTSLAVDRQGRVVEAHVGTLDDQGLAALVRAAQGRP
jgi:thiol-disulfide isomerase/thioredoxin